MQRSKPDMTLSVTLPFPAESYFNCRPRGRSGTAWRGKNFLEFVCDLITHLVVAGCAVFWSLEDMYLLVAGYSVGFKYMKLLSPLIIAIIVWGFSVRQIILLLSLCQV